MKILVPTMVGDDHARLVSCAAVYKNFDVVRWFTADYPCQQTVSIHYNNGPVQWNFKGAAINSINNHFDVVWLRRPVPPLLPDSLHPDDRLIANRENATFFRSLWHALANDAAWINSYPAHLAARSKVLQLNEAKKSGLVIPRTLISNDPEDIASFIDTNKPGQTIYKSFFPARWELTDGGAAVLETTIIDTKSLPSDNALRLTPGIFQPYIEKAFEVRATFMGAHVVAIRLNSQSSKLGKTDYRASPIDGLAPEPINLPLSVYQGCRELMHRLGIVFGCFDFIVTPDQDYIFLEVNEMGQFLWKAQACPETRILDVFLDFLTNPSFDFTWKPQAKGLCVETLLASEEYFKLALEETELHMESFPDANAGFFEARN